VEVTIAEAQAHVVPYVVGWWGCKLRDGTVEVAVVGAGRAPFAMETPAPAVVRRPVAPPVEALIVVEFVDRVSLRVRAANLECGQVAGFLVAKEVEEVTK
jgi:hypothetical protein